MLQAFLYRVVFEIDRSFAPQDTALIWLITREGFLFYTPHLCICGTWSVLEELVIIAELQQSNRLEA